jgi:hypothetical protein
MNWVAKLNPIFVVAYMLIKCKIIANDHTYGKDFKLQLKIHNCVI